MRPFEKRKDFLVTFFFITKSLSLFPVIASFFLPVIATFPFPVIARSEATKQSPHCSFLLVLSVLRGLLRSLRSLAMTGKGVFARNDAIGLFALNSVTKTLLIGLQRSYFSIFLLKYKGKL